MAGEFRWNYGLLVGWMSLAAVSAEVGDFTPPAETPSFFRRDQVPLDREMQRRLSLDLSEIVGGLDGKTPESRRAAAQFLALAVALDPGNRQAKTRLDQFKRGRHVVGLDAAERLRVLQTVKEVIAGLNFPEAGEAGGGLAACLSDLLRWMGDGSEPPTEAERGNWDNWVPGIAAYEARQTTQDQRKSQPEMPTVKDFALTEAEVETAIWIKTPSKAGIKWSLRQEKLKMKANMVVPGAGESPPFSFEGRGPGESIASEQSRAVLRQVLKNEGIVVPEQGTIVIGSELENAALGAERSDRVSAAAAVLASAAITGRQPDAIILGTVDSKGTYQLPRGIWEQLRCLGPGNGRRLVLPTAAATAELPAILALENPKFFFDYEVVLAANFHDVLEYSAKQAPESLVKGFTGFQQVREKQGAQSLGQYLANPFVRRRLSEIFQLAPNFASVQMLGIQGAGNRPIHVARSIFAVELRAALEPLAWLLERKEPLLEVTEFRQISISYEASAKEVERLSRYAERSDEDLLTKLKDVLGLVRALERCTRARGDEYAASLALNVAHTTLIRSAAEFQETLRQACNDGVGTHPVEP